MKKLLQNEIEPAYQLIASSLCIRRKKLFNSFLSLFVFYGTWFFCCYSGYLYEFWSFGGWVIMRKHMQEVQQKVSAYAAWICLLFKFYKNSFFCFCLLCLFNFDVHLFLEGLFVVFQCGFKGIWGLEFFGFFTENSWVVIHKLPCCFFNN